VGTRPADQRSPLTITAAAAGGAVVLALVLGPVASAATSASQQASARADAVSQPLATQSSGQALGPGLELPETGAINLKPYLVGGGIFLVVGGGLLAVARRRGLETGLDAETEPAAEAGGESETAD
jgi:LPXTG-motif cell wall-anchored protein